MVIYLPVKVFFGGIPDISFHEVLLSCKARTNYPINVDCFLFLRMKAFNLEKE